METHSHLLLTHPQLCPMVTSEFAIHLATDQAIPFQINGEDVTVAPGDGVFINADQIMFTEKSTLCLELTSAYLRERGKWQSKLLDLVQEKKIQPYFVLHNSDPREKAVLDGVRVLKSIQENNPSSYPLLAPGIVYSMFQILTEEIEENCALDFPRDELVRCKELLRYFAEHYKDKITLPELSAEFDVTPNTCIKTVRKYTGITPIDYLTLYRMNEACKLLTTTKAKVQDIAVEVGIPDKSYFTASFRKVLGMTPSKYRKQNTPQAE